MSDETDALPFFVQCDDGWLELVRACHEELVRLDPEYTVLQVKEKFGSLRYYYATTHEPSDARATAMRDIVTKYEALSSTVCESCGSHGATNTRHDGWWRTTCEAHRPT